MNSTKKLNKIETKNEKNFLGVKTIVSDIKELPKMYKIILLVIGILSLILSFIDFNHFISPNDFESIWSIVNTLNQEKDFLAFMPKWLDATFYSLSGLASFTSVLCVFLISFGKMSNYFWGVINAISFGLFALDFGYAGDAQINILFYLPCQFFGWYFWIKNQSLDKNSTTDLEIKKSKTWLVTLISLIICIPLTIGFYFEVPAVYEGIFNVPYAYSEKSQMVPRIFDSFTDAIAIVAMILMIMRFKENWILWLIANVVNLIMFCGLNTLGSDNPIQISPNQIIQLVFLTINSFIGLFAWSGIIKKTEK